MILKVLVYVNTALMVGLLGGGFFGYRYVTSPQFEEQIKNKLSILRVYKNDLSITNP